MIKSNYRPEIDGLRAVAVLSVVFYHVGGAQIFSGGFVGVDVFFVISGYLITRLIKAEVESDTFSYSNFYVRRARRLFPAFFATLLLSFLAAFLWFSPDHLERFGGALVHAIMSVSNFYFWQESGYFDISSEFKPLLHTWSLSVEEQFYMFWPLLLVFLLTRRSQWALTVLLILAGVSLGASEWLISNNTPETAFFLTPFRVYEFAIGASIVWFERYRLNQEWLYNLLCLAGLSLIAASVFTFTIDTRFPGVSALVPSLGTALVIYSGSSFVGRTLLGNRACVRIGLISYSLYLTHWPIYVFYRYVTFDTLDTLQIIIIVALSLVMAELLYRYVETPFRKTNRDKAKLSATAFGLLCSLLALVITLPAATAWSKDGWPWRVANDLQELVAIGDKVTKEETLTWGQGSCYIGGPFTDREETFPEDFDFRNCFGFDDAKPNIVILGDSNAAHIMHGLIEAYPEIRFIQVTAASCRPIFNWGDKHNCSQMIAFTLTKYLPKYRNEIDAVVFMGRWFGKSDTFLRLADTVERVNKEVGIPIIVVGDQPELKSGLVTLASKFGRVHGLTSYLEEHRVKYENTSNLRLKELIGENASFVDFHDMLCQSQCEYFINGELKSPITKDGNHYTPEGAIHLANKLKAKGFLSEYF
jgi:peptidoglycan/LPS O-acetylase OafA/YrhL